jgi:hypothetical protein
MLVGDLVVVISPDDERVEGDGLYVASVALVLLLPRDRVLPEESEPTLRGLTHARILGAMDRDEVIGARHERSAAFR